jgi:hypothetical protein
MRTFAAVIGGTVAVVLGSLLVLFCFPAAFVQNPRLHGTGYCLAVANGLLLSLTGRLGLCGLAALFAGVVLTLHATFPDGREMAMSRAGRVALFWSLALLGTSTMLVLLAGVTLCTIGLD